MSRRRPNVPNLDDRVRSGLERLAPVREPDDVLDRIASRRRRYRVGRRVQASVLSISVLALAAGGTYGLVRAFSPSANHRLPIGGSVAGGRIAYVVGSGANAVVQTVNPDGSDPLKLVQGRD